MSGVRRVYELLLFEEIRVTKKIEWPWIGVAASEVVCSIGIITFWWYPIASMIVCLASSIGVLVSSLFVKSERLP